MRSCFGMSATDADRSYGLLGAAAFRFEPADSLAPVGMLATWRAAQWFGGRPVSAAPVAFVAVDPAARGAGCADRLLRRMLAEWREQEIAVAVLYPSVARPYQKIGFARAGVARKVSCAPACFGAPGDQTGGKPPPIVRLTDGPLSPADVDGLAAVRREELRRVNGGMERDEILWTLALRPNGDDDVDVYVVPSLVPGPMPGPNDWEGYIALTPVNDGKLTVVDACLPTGRAAKAAMGLLANFRSAADRIEWSAGPDDLMFHMLDENAHSIDSEDEWMLRIVNVPAALSQRGYPPHLDAQVVLYIDDDVLPGNRGAWRLTVKDGKGKAVAAKDNSDYDVRLSVSALASLFSGYLGAETLRRMGRIEIDMMQTNYLNSIFSAPYPHMTEQF